jgi:tetratricopeptide (TPR) repeat protein
VIKDDDDSSGSKLERHEPTSIDLGDDLVEKTAIIPGHVASTASAAGEDQPALAPSELIRNARILLGEGFPEEAKKTLRQILLADADHEEAKTLLERIHESELRQMFGSAEPAVRKSFSSSYDESILDVDSDEIVRILDRDLGLGEGEAPAVPSMFSDARLLAQFADQVDREVGEQSQDRADLAIAFIEMGLYPVAIRLLQTLLVAEEEKTRLNASALAAHAHLMNNEPYRTISVLQPVLNDGEIDKSRKTECFYLMGRAEQLLGAHARAIGWYYQAQSIETDYRDIARRIQQCKRVLAAK